LNKQIEDLKKKLNEKDEQMKNINNLNKSEFNKIKSEKDLLSAKNNEKDKQINELIQANKQLKKNNTSGQLLQKKEQEISQKMKKLEEKEKYIKHLNEQYKDLENINVSLENNVSDLKKKKEKLINDIKQCEAQLLKIQQENQNASNQNRINNNINNNNTNNGNQQRPPQNQNQFMQNNKIMQPINNQSFPMNQQNMTPNFGMQMPNMLPIFNQNPSVQMNNFGFTPQNQMMNNQGFNQILNPPSTNNTPIIPITLFVPSNDPPPRKPKGIIATYKAPTLIGLNNIGSTCYKNSVLQCLSQTHDLTNYFLKPESQKNIIYNNIAKKNPRELQLCPIFYQLIKNLWNKHATYNSFSPYDFMKSIENMTKNDPVKFTLNEAGDAKDFILYILERMHTELRRPISNQSLLGQKKPETELNQYDKKNALEHFMEQFAEETSIISDVFYGFNETTNVCQFCKNDFNSRGQKEPICYNYGIFNILIFPLDEVRKYRDKFYQANNPQMVTLFDCFCYNQKSDYFTGDNKNYCNICKKLYDSVYTSKIFVGSNVLIMILNRGKGNEFKIKLDFSKQINISDFVLCKGTGEIYNLYGVITHIGESGPNAHFVAACRSPVDGKWYRYNDAMVTPIENFQRDVYDFGLPYILFYEKQQASK
jgi:ubiquitin C-terminal hydrolase